MLKKWKNKKKSLLNNERGQGATEYILLLVVVVAVVVIFKDKIRETVQGKVDSLSSDIMSFSGQ